MTLDLKQSLRQPLVGFRMTLKNPILVRLILIQSIPYLSIHMFMTMLPIYYGQMGFTYVFFIVMFIGAFINRPLQYFWSSVFDRFHIRKYALVLIYSMDAFMFLFVLPFVGFWEFVVLSVVTTILFDAPVLSSMIAEHLKEDSYGKGYSTVFTIAHIFGASGTFLSGIFFENFGFMYILIAVGVSNAISLGIALTLPKDTKRVVTRKDGSFSKELFKISNINFFIVLALILFLFQAGGTVFKLSMGLYLYDYGVSESLIGIIYSVPLLIGIVLMPFVGYYTDKIGARRVIIFVVALDVMVEFLIFFFFSTNLVYLASIAYMVPLMPFIMISRHVLIAKNSTERDRTKAFALMSFALALGGAFGALIGIGISTIGFKTYFLIGLLLGVLALIITLGFFRDVDDTVGYNRQSRIYALANNFAMQSAARKKIFATIGITCLVIMSGVYIHHTIPNGAPKDEANGFSFTNATSSLSCDGYVSENSEATETIEVDYERITSVTATLSWTDEPVAGWQDNEPDELGIKIIAPNGNATALQSSVEGNLIVTMSMDEETWRLDGDALKGAWIFTITCGECGDVTGPAGLRDFNEDTGNDWALEVEFNYQTMKEVTE